MIFPRSNKEEQLSTVKNNNFNQVKELLKKGIDPNIKDMANRHILLFATARGNPQIIESLLK